MATVTSRGVHYGAYTVRREPHRKAWGAILIVLGPQQYYTLTTAFIQKCVKLHGGLIKVSPCGVSKNRMETRQ